jgi:hypothetical protein
MLLNSNNADATPTDEQRDRIESARRAVRDRAATLDQNGVIRDVSDDLLDAHIEKLRQGDAAPYFAEGWRVALVDLARVCAFQPAVFTDSAADRAAGVDADDQTQLARVTLPTESNAELRAQRSEERKQWLFVSRNPNLKITGMLGGKIDVNTPPVFGFFVTVMPSYMQIATYQGRHFLRDGYHRAIGLLGVGAREVPAFVREFSSIAQLVPQGMLPQEGFLGDRPPTLSDYADDQVAATVQLPASQKMIVVQGLELSVSG